MSEDRIKQLESAIVDMSIERTGLLQQAREKEKSSNYWYKKSEELEKALAVKNEQYDRLLTQYRELQQLKEEDNE